MKNGIDYVLESERLIFRELLPSDVDVMFELESDPDVVRYTGDLPLVHKDQARRRIDDIRQEYRDFGVGRWAAVLKDTHACIGWAGLKFIKEINDRKDVYDLGYRLLREHWGKGYATESSMALLRYGFEQKKMRRISAYVDVNHAASARVLQKCGLTLTNTFREENDLCAWYEIAECTLRNQGMGCNK